MLRIIHYLYNEKDTTFKDVSKVLDDIQNGDMEDFENMTLGEIIKIYEKKIGKDKE